MNRRRVIILVTIGMLVVFGMVALMFHGVPWPILLWFAVSYLFFCVVISRVKPFRGPYTEPMDSAEPWRD